MIRVKKDSNHHSIIYLDTPQLDFELKQAIGFNSDIFAQAKSLSYSHPPQQIYATFQSAP